LNSLRHETTFDDHRIHSDNPYEWNAEGYEGLVVHRRLQATLMFNLTASALLSAPKTFS
jgi:hydroxyacyl-ACP dehydratase HTD2-like protein with hotdog domain